MKRPLLRSDLTIVEQTYRGEQSFIVKEHATHKYFRFKLLEIMVMQQFDGERTYAEAAAALAEQGLPLKLAAVEGFARKLDQMGLLEKTVAERSVLLMERLRAERNRRVKRTHYAGSILRMRWSVGDPDKWFDRMIPRLGFFFSKPFLALSLALFIVYTAVVAARWPEVRGLLTRLYTPSSYTLGFIVLFWGTALVVIVIHELGHGFTCKYFGGEVHEMGAMLIYFQPAFYCNVNDAWTFPGLKARLWVTAAGSWIQMVLAGIAAIVLWVVAPGTLVSQIALIMVLVGGVTTVLANANPLIPLDGYYALSDYLAVPNLRKRAFGYLGWLFKRYVLWIEAPEPPLEERERKVFVIYGLLSLAYSVSLLSLIVSRLFGRVVAAFGAIGVLVFLVFLWRGLKRHLRNLVQGIVTSVREHRDLWRSPRFQRRAGVVMAAVVVLGLLVPWPITVGGVFTASAPVEFGLTAAEGAVVARVFAEEGQRVPAGAPVLALRNLEIEREALATQRLADSLGVLAIVARARGATAEQRRLEAAQGEELGALNALRSRIELLTLRAPVAAVVATPRLGEMLGKRLARGDTAVRLLGSPDSVQLRIVLDRAGATLVRQGQVARVVPYSDPSASVRAPVVAVSTAGLRADTTVRLEAQVLLPANGAFRTGVTGEAKILVRRSNVLGALLWAVRKRVRSDLLL